VPRRLKLAMVVGAFPKLSETFVLQQITSLLDLGHDVHIFAFEQPREAVVHPVVQERRLLERTLYLNGPSRISSRLGGLLATVRGREPERFDALVCHFGHVAEKARMLRRQRRLGGPLAVVFHAYDLTVWLATRPTGAYSPLLAEAALLLPISEHWREKLLNLGADPRKLEVLRMGVDCDAFQYRERSAEPSTSLRLLSVGRLVEKKGFVYAIEALAKARASLGNRRILYEIVGDGPLREELQRAARYHGVDDLVVFHGALATDRIRVLMDSMHCLVVPSVTAADGDMEGLPIVLMEAMAQGLSIIATRHSGIPELVRDGETGRTVPERDAAALAQAVVDWARTPETWPLLTARARRLIEQDFDARIQAERLVDALTRHGVPP
jgi:colanic acid/amylovoran biosynthesis glycosyltransferase